MWGDNMSCKRWNRLWWLYSYVKLCTDVNIPWSYIFGFSMHTTVIQTYAFVNRCRRRTICYFMSVCCKCMWMRTYTDIHVLYIYLCVRWRVCRWRQRSGTTVSIFENLGTIMTFSVCITELYLESSAYSITCLTVHMRWNEYEFKSKCMSSVKM